MSGRLQAIPYRPDTAPLCAALAGEPWRIWLDSGPPEARQGRYDILVADPFRTLVTRGAHTWLVDHRGGAIERRADDPFDLLRAALGERQPAPAGLPFAGGAVGLFAYDLARRIERLPAQAVQDTAEPDMAVGLYDWALVVDHAARRSWLVSAGRDPHTAARWPELVARLSDPPPAPPAAPFHLRGRPRPHLDAAAYAERFARVQAYIRAGDCYQVNLARRFEAPCSGDPWQAYLRLRRVNPAPFAAWLDLPGLQVLSSSPERFLRVRDRQVLTQPIKGTRARHPDPAEDARRRAALQASAKDRAENVMIVDLLRNDLSRSCAPHSVRVPRLWGVESFARVHHLVSDVTGRLAGGRDALHLLRGCFPGGSITGAPKIRAVEIIDELEGLRRGVYCGSIAWLGFNGDMDSNIAIRTITHAGGRLRFWAGGGIVADSRCEAEYRETLDKAAALLQALEETGDPA